MAAGACIAGMILKKADSRRGTAVVNAAAQDERGPPQTPVLHQLHRR
jgi:hypothetical protein